MQRRKVMEYLLVSFRSRNHTVKFYEDLKRVGLPAEIVNTPKEAGVGCGLSIKIPVNYFSAVKNAVRVTGYKSFAGFFSVKHTANKTVVRSI